MKAREIAHQLRGLIARGVVTKSSDAGESQTVDAKVYAGHDRAGVEVLQPFGVASRAPANGVVILLAVGGDQGDYVALPTGSPGNRMAGLEEGEVAIYCENGSRVHVKKDGTVHAFSSTKVLAEVGENTIELTADLVRSRIGEGEEAPRFVANDEMVKLRIKQQWIVLTEGGIVSSVPIVPGADPDPSV